MGWDANWLQAERQLYYNPSVVLLDPDGGMRLVENLSGLSPSQVLGQVLRQLHVAVPSESETISFAEAEANMQALYNPNPNPNPNASPHPHPSPHPNMQALYNENVAWEKVLEEDESLRQPTRSWFDGMFAGKAPTNPLLSITPYISLHLPTSPYISLHLPSISLYLPLSPYQAPTNPLLAGVESAALPAAMEQYLAEVEGEG